METTQQQIENAYNNYQTQLRNVRSRNRRPLQPAHILEVLRSWCPQHIQTHPNPHQIAQAAYTSQAFTRTNHPKPVTTHQTAEMIKTLRRHTDSQPTTCPECTQ